MDEYYGSISGLIHVFVEQLDDPGTRVTSPTLMRRNMPTETSVCTSGAPMGHVGLLDKLPAHHNNVNLVESRRHPGPEPHLYESKSVHRFGSIGAFARASRDSFITRRADYRSRRGFTVSLSRCYFFFFFLFILYKRADLFSLHSTPPKQCSNQHYDVA